MVGKDKQSLESIEKDSRVKHERKFGLTIVDVSSCKILWTEESDIRKNMFARVQSMMKHWYRYNQPHYYQQRLEELSDKRESSLNCFKSFVQHGLLPQEFITINSIKKSIETFFAHFAGSISEYRDGWKDFTSKDNVTNELNFSEHKFYTPTMHLSEFQKQFCKTQLLASYFEEKMVLDRDEEIRAAQFIADWVYFTRWKNDK